MAYVRHLKQQNIITMSTNNFVLQGIL